MRTKFSRILCIFLILQLVMSIIAPVTVYANDATMLEPLIEPNTRTYKVEVISDSHSWFSQHYENKYISFNNYYKDMCTKSFGTANTGDLEDIKDALKSNPAYCMSLDDDIKLDTYGGAGQGYEFFLAAEGYKNSSGIVSEDNKISEITTNNDYSFGGKSNDFTSGKSDGMKVLTFPAMHNGGAKDVTQAETEYAIEIGNTLSNSLNSMLSKINDGKRYNSITELVNKSILIRPNSNGYSIINNGTDNKGYLIVYGSPKYWGDKIKIESSTSGSPLTSGTFSMATFSGAKYPNADNNGNLLAYIIPIKAKATGLSATNVNYSDLLWDEMATFIWAMPKGYVKIDGLDNSLKFTNDKHEEYSFASEGNDTPWITIHHISMYANNAYKNHNISIATKTSSTDSGNWIMTIIVEFFQNLLHGLRTVLHLSDMHTLVYNKGARASSSYNYGAMPDSWWTVVLRYHLIFQSLAWFLIICGFIKVLIDLNLSTINPGKRMSVMQTVQRFIVCGFLLVTVIPIIQFMLNMNSSIVNIFASQVDPNATEAPVIASLAGLVLQFAYFGICVYINFTYIMRSIIIGILTVTAPFFIASMAFSSTNKQIFDSWLRELTANIFMQSVHAFSLAFLTNLVATGGGLESLVVSYSIIPLTELVRSLIFQGAGSHASNLGMAAGSKYLNATRAAASTVGNAVAGGVMNKLDNGESKAEGAGQGSGQGAGSGMGKSSKIEQLSAQLSQKATAAQGAEKAKANDSGGASIGQNLKMGALSTGKAALGFAGMAMNAMNMAMDMADAEMTGNTAGYKSFGENAGKGIVNTAKMSGNAVAGMGSAAASAVQAGGAAVRGVNAALGGKEVPKTSAREFMSAPRGVTGNNLNQENIESGTPAAPNPSANVVGVRTTPSGSATITQLKSEFGSTYSNDNGGGINETISSSNLNVAAQSSRVHQLVQQASTGDAATSALANEELKKRGVSWNRDAGGDIRINYGRDYIRASGLQGVNAGYDGTLFAQKSGTGSASICRNFTPEAALSGSAYQQNNHYNGQQNPAQN